MMRIVRKDGQVALDARQRMPGRGAYVHPDEACIVQAVARGGLARSLHGQVPASLLDALRNR